MPRAHAEAVAEGAAAELDDQLEQRLGRLETGLAEVRTEVGELRTELRTGLADLRTDIASLRGELKAGLYEQKSSMLMWMILLLSAQLLAILAVLINLTLKR